ncbi:MAG: hypothetical protein WA539_16695, partial [Candidatus Sulfotelmatobacter sp.]
MILAMILIAGAMPATSGAQAGGGGGSDQGGGQTACGPDTGKPCPTGSSATGTGTAGEQPNWQNGFTQKQTSNAAGAQGAGKAKGAQTTAPAGARAAANRAVPQPLESVENPNTLSGCPTMPIEEEINPAEEESNPNGASNANQG